MKRSTKKKIKTTAFWSGILSSLLIFIQSVATLLGHPIAQDVFVGILASANSLMSLLTLSGVLVNPEHVDSFQVMMAKIKKK